MVFLKTESIIEKAKFSGSSLESGQKEPLKMGKSYDRFAVQVFTLYDMQNNTSNRINLGLGYEDAKFNYSIHRQ
jgi:hypothetical protein